MSHFFAATATAEELPVDLHLMVWDVGTCAGRVAPAHVEGRNQGIVRLRVGAEILILGEDDVAAREKLARESRRWDLRERARQGRGA